MVPYVQESDLTGSGYPSDCFVDVDDLAMGDGDDDDAFAYNTTATDEFTDDEGTDRRKALDWPKSAPSLRNSGDEKEKGVGDGGGGVDVLRAADEQHAERKRGSLRRRLDFDKKPALGDGSGFRSRRVQASARGSSIAARHRVSASRTHSIIANLIEGRTRRRTSKVLEERRIDNNNITFS